MTPPRGRALATLAVGFLGLDAVLFLYAAVVTGRWTLYAACVACVAGTGLVVVAWHRYGRALHELDEARRAMRAEVDSLRELLQSRQSHN